MPGSFDGFRISMRGLNASRKQMEVTGNNISQASNENYTRQDARLVSLGDIFDGQVSLGQGVEVSEVVRIRDELLDVQIRDAQSSAGYYDVKTQWLQRIESLYNEPSDTGVKKSLSNFWDAWSELSNDPEGLASRSNVLSRGQTLSNIVHNLHSDLSEVKRSLEADLVNTVDQVNELLSQLAELNNGIFDQESGGKQKANNLRDSRDAVIDDLAKLIDIRYREESNGMVTVLFGDRPAVWVNSFEGIKVEMDSLSTRDPKIYWEHGDQPVEVLGGELKALFDLRRDIVPQEIAELDAFVGSLINEVNKIYANGVGLAPETVLQSENYIDVFNLASEDSSIFDALGLNTKGPDGDPMIGELHISFYDSEGKVTRTHGVLIEPDTSLNDLIDHLSNIDGFDAALIEDNAGNKKFKLQFDSTSAASNEVGFAISNNTGGYDTSGFLDLVGFSANAKSTNDNATTAASLSTSTLEPLKALYGNNDLDDIIANQELGLAGSFTLNGFLPADNDGTDELHHLLQLRVDVESTDTIQDIMDKVNAYTAEYGFSMEYDDTTETLILDHDYKLDAFGAYVADTDPGAVSDYFTISFANTYLAPAEPTDTPPIGYNGLGDNTDFFSTLHLNTFFSGSSGLDMSVSSTIATADDVHAGFKLGTGSSGAALALNELQFANVSSDGSFTLDEEYNNIITSLGADVSQARDLKDNENLVLSNFLSERESISGVNIDEELTNMILFQRVYEANARMMTTMNQLMEEILKF